LDTEWRHDAPAARRARLLLAAAAGFALAAPTCVRTDWFLLAGQSNMVGRSDQETPVGPGSVYRAMDDIWWHEVRDPEVFGAGTPVAQSAWPAFAALHPRRVNLIATALGGTCLREWPGVAGRWDPDTGDLYARAVGQWEQAGEPRLAAVLWLQGECDAGYAWRAGFDYAATHALYKSALLELADAVHDDFGAPLVVAPISLRRCSWDNPTCEPALFAWECPFCRPVHDATIDAAAEHPNIVLGPDTDDLRHMPDGAHIWDVNELGRRWVEAVRGLP
jgi:hypothetical protein